MVIDDPIHQGIDGLYRNNSYKEDGTGSNVQYVIDEAKFGTSNLSTDAKDGRQMSDSWLTGANTGNSRILAAVNNDEALATDIEQALKDGRAVRVLSKVDADGNVQTYELDANGKEIGPWPR